MSERQQQSQISCLIIGATFLRVAADCGRLPSQALRSMEDRELQFPELSRVKKIVSILPDDDPLE